MRREVVVVNPSVKITLGNHFSSRHIEFEASKFKLLSQSYPSLRSFSGLLSSKAPFFSILIPNLPITARFEEQQLPVSFLFSLPSQSFTDEPMLVCVRVFSASELLSHHSVFVYQVHSRVSSLLKQH